MVQVREQLYLDASGEIDLDRWLDQLPVRFEPAEAEPMLEAVRLARDARDRPGHDAGDWAVEGNCFLAGLETAQILADLHVGSDCLVAGILYRAVREDRIALEELETHFSDGALRLLRGVLRMAAISDLNSPGEAPVLGQAHGQKDNIRKMLIAMVDDVRVALIKLAERTCAIRAVKNDSQRRHRVAQEVFDVYAPLAHRLGRRRRRRRRRGNSSRVKIRQSG